MAFGSNSKKGRNLLPQKKPPIEKGRWAAKGNKPLPQQTTIKQIFVLLIMHTCRKVLFIQTEVKITLYAIALFFGSLVCDFLPIPPIYLAHPDNIIYLYFVRPVWLWSMIVICLFIYMTSITYSCGRKEIVKRHLARPLIATLIWLVWMQVVFVKVEASTGICLGKSVYVEKMHCVINGFQWHSFHVSGPSFVLVYVNLLLVEEAKAIFGWEGIKDLIRMEEHKRSTLSVESDDSSLSRLTLEELFNLKNNYEFWTPYIRVVFLLMTAISLLCDVMIACVVIYFNTMPTKVAGGAVAIATWFVTYRYWYKKCKFPGLAGTGFFSYQEGDRKICSQQRRSSLTKEKKPPATFMGMPIHVSKETEEIEMETDNIVKAKKLNIPI